MAVLLYHEEDKGNGQVALSEGHIAGEHTPARVRQHKGHFLEVDGPAHVIQHDVEEILKLPGYRLATPEEQEEHTKSERKSRGIKEGK